jgi:hypothetical protein
MVAVNARGVGAIVMSLAGPAAFPSAAYAKVRGGEVPGHYVRPRAGRTGIAGYVQRRCRLADV